MLRLLAQSLLVLLLGMSSFAKAAIVSWDFTGNGGDLGFTHTFVADGISVTVFAFQEPVAGVLVPASIDQTTDGLGVLARDGVNELDNVGTNMREILLFDFFTLAPEITPLSVGLRLFDPAEEAVLTPTADGGTDLFLGLFDGTLVSGSGLPLDIFDFNDRITLPGFASVGVAAARDLGTAPPTAFRVASLRAAVPEPGAMSLLFAGLMGLPFCRRGNQADARRKRIVGGSLP